MYIAESTDTTLMLMFIALLIFKANQREEIAKTMIHAMQHVLEYRLCSFM
jgi:hypothetical protein